MNIEEKIFSKILPNQIQPYMHPNKVYIRNARLIEHLKINQCSSQQKRKNIIITNKCTKLIPQNSVSFMMK
jgi:hypothetical protein